MSTPAQVVAAIATAVRDVYADADAGARAADALLAAAAAGTLGDLSGPRAADGGADPRGADLAVRVTRALHTALPDERLQVRWSPSPMTRPPRAPDPDTLRAREDLANQGVSRVERLDGNVGLLVVHGLEEAMDALDSAFAFLARCSALVLDLRRTLGGSPAGVAHLLGHLLPPGTPLIEVVDRTGRVITATRTGERPPTIGPDVPVYALIGRRTVRGCEELAYDLQVSGRATLVGVPTAGAANPVDIVVVDPQMLVRIPNARVRHRLTGSSWEGVGVTPDVVCAADDAPGVAHRLAARAVLERVYAGGVRAGEVLLEELDDVLTALDTELGRPDEVFRGA